MKRFPNPFNIVLIAIGTILLTSTICYAGILGTVGGYIKGEALSIIIGGILGALGMFGISYKLWGQAVKELGECVWSIYSATRATSNGGKEITKSEMEKIIKEATEIYPAVASAIASRKKVTA